MAEEQINDAAENPGEGGQSNGSSPLKLIIILLVVMIVEGGAIYAFMALSGGPAEVQADPLQEELDNQANKLTEIEIAKDRFLNLKTGRTVLYDTQIFITVKNKHAEKTKTDIEASKAQISSEIARILQQAEDAHFAEPTKGTLKRLIKAMMDERFKLDEDNEPIIQSILITKCIPIRVN